MLGQRLLSRAARSTGAGCWAQRGRTRMTSPATPELAAAPTPLLSARALTRQYGGRNGCKNVSFDLYPGEVLCIVGESGSGKTTLLNTLALRTEADSGTLQYTAAHGATVDLRALSEPRRRLLMRTEWGFVQQNPRDGL